MDHTKVLNLSEKVGGTFRLAVLLQKRVQELVAGAPKLVETRETDPIRVAVQEVEAGVIDLVDLTDEELSQIQTQTQQAHEEAELLEALRARVTASTTGDTSPGPVDAAAQGEGAQPAPSPPPAAPSAPADDGEDDDEDF